MSFRILYVEDDDKDWRPVAEAVSRHNSESGEVALDIERAISPEDLRRKLDGNFDVILADVFFGDVNRLGDILQSIEIWAKRQPSDRSLPVIAYTGMGDDVLASCMQHKDRLYDIWDKHTAFGEYIAWRLSSLAVEVSRNRPDAKMQQLISSMLEGCSWHDHVVDMTRRYDAGWTERDQVERAGAAIENIAHCMGVWDQCAPMWNTVKRWEWMGRAASNRIRGHARHVINVFWMGYFFINYPILQTLFGKSWKHLIAQRSDMSAVADMKAREALSDAWFYAGLFHDVAGCVEKAQLVADAQIDLLTPFWSEPLENPRFWANKSASFSTLLESTAGLFDEPLRNCIKQVADEGLRRGSVDHGILGASHLQRIIVHNRQQACLAREAARAVALHNLFPGLDKKSASFVSWDREPIACLLLLCDQLQTWDRERGDTALRDEDKPQRAELSHVSIEKRGARHSINIRIDYIAPAHVLRSKEIYGRLRDELENVLKDKPSRALKNIGNPWPFDLTVECSLSGKPLHTRIVLPE